MPVQAYGVFLPTDDKKHYIALSHVVSFQLNDGKAILNLDAPLTDGRNVVELTDPKIIAWLKSVLSGKKSDSEEQST